MGTMTERRDPTAPAATLGARGDVRIRRCGVVDCLAIARNCKNWTRVGNLLDLGIIYTNVHQSKILKFSNRETELNSQFGATGGTATRDDQATLVASHADTENMGTGESQFHSFFAQRVQKKSQIINPPCREAGSQIEKRS